MYYFFCERGRSGLDPVERIRCFLAHDLSRLRKMKDFDERNMFNETDEYFL